MQRAPQHCRTHATPPTRLRACCLQRRWSRPVRIGSESPDAGRLRGREMTIDDSVLERHGVTREEYQRILEMLGREPTITELGIFSVMWSEHCSYKSSRVHLKTLPTTGKRVLQGPG